MTEAVDYNTLYKNHEVCPNCNQKTPDGIEAYKSKTNKLVKTCRKCRAIVRKSLQASKKLTMKEQNIFLKNMLEEEQTLTRILAIKYPKLKKVINMVDDTET